MKDRPRDWEQRRLDYLAKRATETGAMPFKTTEKIADYEAGAGAMLGALRTNEVTAWTPTTTSWQVDKDK